MLTLNTLRITFTRHHNTFSDMSFISNILITINNTYSKKGQVMCVTHLDTCVLVYQNNTLKEHLCCDLWTPKPALVRFIRNKDHISSNSVSATKTLLEETILTSIPDLSSYVCNYSLLAKTSLLFF